MADQFTSDEPSPRSGLLRKLGIVLAALLVLVVVAYFVVSSSAFLKGVILPRAAKALKADISVAEASLSPFSQVTLNQLKLQTTGAEPVLAAEQVRVRYSLFSILRGHYVVNELTLVSPTVQIVTEPNGSSNLDPLTKQEKSSSSKSTEPLRLAIHNVSVKNGTIRTVSKAQDGSVKTTQLSQLELALDRIENGQPGKLNFTTGLNLENRIAPKTGGTNDLAEGKAQGNFEYKLDANLLPQTLSGNGRVDLTKGEGAYKDMAQFATAFQAEMTPDEVRQLAVRFERSGKALGKIQASGPLNLAKSEGRLKIEIQSIDRQVLNVFGASHGWDFADSSLNATNFVDITNRGEKFGVKGQVAGRQVSIRQQGQSTPVINLDVDYDVFVNLNDKMATIQRLTLAGQQQQNEILKASLDRPMTVTWAQAPRGYKDSTFQLKLTQLNLKDWQALLGTNLSSGRVDLQVSVQSTDDAKLLIARGKATVQDFSAQFGTNRIDQAQLSANLDGRLEEFKRLQIDPFKIDVRQLNQPLLAANGSIAGDLSQNNLSVQANAEAALPAVLRQFPTPQLTATKGAVRLSSALVQKNTKYSLTGNVSLSDFTGKSGEYAFENYQAGLDYNVDVEQPAVKIHSAALSLRKGYADGGKISLDGEYDLAKSIAQLSFKLLDLNQNALDPFLASSLGTKKLASISLSGSGSTHYDPKGDASLKGDLVVTNWVVSDSAAKLVSPNLGAQLQLDGSMRQQIVDVRKLAVKLSPTTNAANELQLTAHLDLAKTNASPSQMSLQAESLDLTPYYNMFAGTKTNASATSRASAVKATAPTPVPAPQPGEPAPTSLPFEQLTADVKIGSLYLRQVAISNLQASAKVNRGEVTLKPVQLTLNTNGLVSANGIVNLSVPGYTYDLSFQANRVPLEPLSNTFTTNAPGTYKGDLYAQGSFKGAGLTDAGLKKNLNGALSLNLTNMNYEIVTGKPKRILEPISLALRVPELTQTPVNWISATSQISKGQIDLQQFAVHSQAFHAETRGIIPMADVLTNSPLNLPLKLSLLRSLAEKARLLPANTPTNATYVELPTFATLTGTLGDSKTEINKLALGGLLARSIGSFVPAGSDASTYLQGAATILTGQAGARSTNAPASTNAVANLVQGVSDLIARKGSAGTNAPAGANTNAVSGIVQGLSGVLNQPKQAGVSTNPPASNTNTVSGILQGLGGLLNQPKKSTTSTNPPAKGAPTSR